MSYFREKKISKLEERFLASLNQPNVFSEQASEEDLKELFNEIMTKGMHGLCFSMYEENQEPGDHISESQVMRRMKILQPHTQWIRSFSCIEGNEFVPKVAKELGIKTLVGAWLSDDLEKNREEIDALIQLANEGKVDIAAVGNEVLYREELELDELLAYMKEVRKKIPAHIPIGYVDAYYEFSKHPELVEHSDVILANCYPFWEKCPFDYSLAHMQQMYGQVLSVSNGKKVIITETGWPSNGQTDNASQPSKENALKYFINAQLWSRSAGIEMFYFSSFDESWKVGAEGNVGAYWGIWDKSENLKF